MAVAASEACIARQPRDAMQPPASAGSAALDLDEKITPTDLKLLQSNPSTETRAQFAAKFGRQYDAFSATSSKEFADTILYHLAKDVEVTVRQALAETIAESLDLPNAIAMELGTDDIDIARPVLERSAVLQDPQLTEIIQSQADYYAFAIAGRQTISEDVSDSLIASENTDTIVRLLNNEGASFSEDGLLRLATDFAGNSHIQEHLVKLPNLPPDVVDRLIDGIGETLEWDLITSRSIEPTEARRLVNAMKGQASKALAKRSAAQLAGSDDLQDRMAKGVLNPLDILSFLRDGNVGKFEIALSTIAKVDLKHTRRLLYNLDKRAIAALCLRANMGTPQYMAIRMALDLADSGVSDVHAKRVKYPLKTTRFVQDQYERLRKDEKTIRQFF